MTTRLGSMLGAREPQNSTAGLLPLYGQQYAGGRNRGVKEHLVTARSSVLLESLVSDCFADLAPSNCNLFGMAL